MNLPFKAPTAGTAGHFALKALAPVSIGFGAVSGYRERRAHGQNALVAGGIELAKAAPQLFLPGLATTWMIGVPLITAGTVLTLNKVHDHNIQNRQTRTPFSHRFEHTEASSRAQAMGMQAIGQAWGHAQMGSEAAGMARRYGR